MKTLAKPSKTKPSRKGPPGSPGRPVHPANGKPVGRPGAQRPGSPPHNGAPAPKPGAPAPKPAAAPAVGGAAAGAETAAMPTGTGGFAIVFVMIAAGMVFAILLGSSLYLNGQSALKAQNATATTAAIALQERRIAQLQAALLDARNGGTATTAADDLAASIDKTFPALIGGGAAETAPGTSATLAAPGSSEARDTASAAAAKWKPVRDAIHAGADRSSLRAAIATLADAEPDLIKDLDALTAQTAANGDAQTGLLGTIRNLITAGAIAVLAGILFLLIRRINSSRDRVTDYATSIEARNVEITRASNDLAQSKASTDLIMQTVTQGLFLMGPDYKIDGQYSKELETIFRVPELKAFNVLNLLQRVLTDRMFNTTKDYFTLLFDRSKKERTVLQVNPLSQVEVNFANSEGGYTSRYLSFTFRRIAAPDGSVSRVFVAVNDITERVELEQQLRLAESAKERQFEFLLGVLHVAPTELDDFLSVAREQLSVMNTALRTQDFAAATVGQMTIFRQRLETVFRSVHTLKGHAQALKFTHFVNVCHQFEAKLVGLRNRSALGGDDFLSVVIAQSELAKDVEELAEVRARFVTVSAAASEGKERRATDMMTTIAGLVERTAEAQGKKARLETAGFETTRLNDDVRRSVKDMLIQFARNSVTHGVESPEERIQFGKIPVATITIAMKVDTAADSFGFTFRDDGRGLDPEAIKARAVKNGLITAEEAAAMPKGQAVGLIFRPGFSTVDVATEDAGRGFGMNIIKDIVVDQLGGKLTIKSEPQRFTEFSVTIPIAQAAAAAPAVREEVPA